MIEALLLSIFVLLVVVKLWLKEIADNTLELYDETINLHKNNTEMWNCIYRLQVKIDKLEGGKDEIQKV